MSNIPTAAPEEQMFPPVKRESLGGRLSRMALRMLGLPARGLPRPRACVLCRTTMELCGDLICRDDDPDRVEAVRFWRCPNCGDGVREWHCYPKYPDLLQ